ncbi:glycosyltransferase family 4 protein [Lysobacter sp. TAF61]|uniref:glycosyltransferase family 4 protein n=1 Tax=Lysobacter sp. TAF61 TaxID=3233072 RepID=UPI003F945399
MINPDRSFGFVIDGSESYGVSRFVTSLVACLLERGVECHVYSLSGGSLADQCEKLGAKVERSGPGKSPNFQSGLRGLYSVVRLVLFGICATSRVRAWVRRRNVDVVVVRMPNLVFLAGISAYNCGKRAYWIMPNEVSSRYPLNLNKRIYDWFFSRFRVVPIANSRYTATTLMNRRVEARVMHLGIESKSFECGAFVPEERASFGLHGEDVVFGVFARLVPEKGQEELIRALAGIISRHRVKVLIVGGPTDGAFADCLKSVATEVSVSSDVIFAGAVRDVRPLYAMCDVVVNSRIDAEPFGLSVIEGMMLGKPVLAHAAGGPGETVVDGVTGWLVRDPSVEAFRNGMMRALADRRRWPQMGQDARAHACEHFSIEAAVDRLELIVERTEQGADRAREALA